jgi:hypothetical protein
LLRLTLLGWHRTERGMILGVIFAFMLRLQGVTVSGRLLPRGTQQHLQQSPVSRGGQSFSVDRVDRVDRVDSSSSPVVVQTLDEARTLVLNSNCKI